MKTISSTKTKAEIIKAYEELAKELETERSSNAKLQKELSQQEKLVQKAKDHVKEGGADRIGSLQASLIQQLDAFKQEWEKEQTAFKELQEAISLEKAHLEEVYQIKHQAETLDALVLTNKESKIKLEKDLDAEKENLLQEIEGIKQHWSREKEAYEYEQGIKRRNEQHEYEEKKAQLDKDLEEKRLAFEETISKREAVVAEKENELKSFQKQVATFEDRLKEAIETTEKQTTEALTKQFKFEKQLELKDLQAELKLGEQMIQSLQAKIEDQSSLIQQLTSKADGASDQVKDIALKAIEQSGGVTSRINSFLDRERSKEAQE